MHVIRNSIIIVI